MYVQRSVPFPSLWTIVCKETKKPCALILWIGIELLKLKVISLSASLLESVPLQYHALSSLLLNSAVRLTISLLLLFRSTIQKTLILKYRSCSYSIRIFLNFTQCVSFAQVPETQNSLVIIISDSFLLFLHHSLCGSLILKYVVSVKVSLLFLRKKFK
jgi:hypothetical protein